MTKLPRRHRHIPALSPEALQAAMERLQASQAISPRVKEHMEAMLRAASDPTSQQPEKLVQSLPEERQANIRAIAETYSAATKAIAKRGKQGLSDISAREWDKLVDEAANGEP